MYAFQFQDGSWRIDVMTSCQHMRPEHGTEEHKLFDGIYQNRIEAEDAIRAIRAAQIAAEA